MKKLVAIFAIIGIIVATYVYASEKNKPQPAPAGTVYVNRLTAIANFKNLYAQKQGELAEIATTIKILEGIVADSILVKK